MREGSGRGLVREERERREGETEGWGGRKGKGEGGKVEWQKRVPWTPITGRVFRDLGKVT